MNLKDRSRLGRLALQVQFCNEQLIYSLNADKRLYALCFANFTFTLVMWWVG